jgi:peptidoglycan/LPS O-acetylase OafA/YrhL
MYSIGTFIERKLIHFQQRRRQEILLSLGIGLCAFLLLINVLLQTNLLYGWVTVALFIGLGACIYAMR